MPPSAGLSGIRLSLQNRAVSDNFLYNCPSKYPRTRVAYVGAHLVLLFGYTTFHRI